mmetsp:Transcript_20439/g.43837  ORF Transcript_20439/g.43837 Transcript_20439/m.43837 type:complete len:295 (-) Transcript_20439:295-1179(-)
MTPQNTANEHIHKHNSLLGARVLKFQPRFKLTMTLPIYMKNRAASSVDGTLQDLEATVVFTLAHRFAPLLCGPDDGSMMSGGLAERKTNVRLLIRDRASSEDYRSVSLPPTPEQPAEKKAHTTPEQPAKKKARTSKPGAGSSCSLPTADDPIDESFHIKLYSPRDEGRINPAHIVIRRDVLEVRRTVSGRVLFQCACCKHLPRAKRARLSTLAPQSVDNLYRAMVRFMMNHVSACEEIPRDIKELSPKASRVVNNERGTKKYWVKSALKKGLRDGPDGKSIIYCCPTAKNCEAI